MTLLPFTGVTRTLTKSDISYRQSAVSVRANLVEDVRENRFWESSLAEHKEQHHTDHCL